MIDNSVLRYIEDHAITHFQPQWPELDPRYVPGEGDNPIAMLIGEAPGAQEAVQQRPFVGASGIMLRRLMLLANLSTGHVEGVRPHGNCWLTNVVKFRPPLNRTPNAQQILLGRKYMRQEWIAIGKPRLIVPVGGTALRAVMGLSYRGTITRKAGRPMRLRDSEGHDITVFPQIHPRYGLSGGEQIKRLMERDWERLGDFIENDS